MGLDLSQHIPINRYNRREQRVARVRWRWVPHPAHRRYHAV